MFPHKLFTNFTSSDGLSTQPPLAPLPLDILKEGQEGLVTAQVMFKIRNQVWMSCTQSLVYCAPPHRSQLLTQYWSVPQTAPASG